MIELNDIPYDDLTKCNIGGTINFSSFIDLREKYSCEEFIKTFFSKEWIEHVKKKISYRDEHDLKWKITCIRSQCIFALAVTWDKFALECLDKLVTQDPTYITQKGSYINDIENNLACDVTHILGWFMCEDAIQLVKKYSKYVPTALADSTIKRIENNIMTGRDPVTYWGKANAKS